MFPEQFKPITPEGHNKYPNGRYEYYAEVTKAEDEKTNQSRKEIK